ncbi:MAG: transcriptional regulator [Sphingomonadales bacterium CG12_big_fil_rev_8_21_14_0_65_65_10]|jgi:DNA-binding HxlR family transcriptional regulator|uniref:HxlR family transcriptional regulator n=1 Tax=Blastomonas marina TaxID=1867408 RepID=A0ABQ1FBT1_9SPHN|nr:helix-turn-helix domain-containing protein [Blastomonas marina]PIW54500.1 MAG: transcriptional regulator [Sphingomonadales bacterium CG12_big_fil_rev_8_21_14_0_65_65_10]WPZ05142.1 helix-turn-helix domain-containing protein [Blastomonas marina]GGA06234.1 HxlR family transcriptional regulator [Blastomonas marina]
MTAPSDHPPSDHPHANPDCRAVSELLSRVGDKWTVLVVEALAEETLRFNELKRHVGGISQQMLTRTLRALERDGMVARTVHPTIPPRVEYALTDLGRSLAEPVMALVGWTFANLPTIHAHRETFDRAQDEAEAA